MQPSEDFWKCAGTALIIFAVLCGLGTCSLGAGIGTYYAERKSP